MVITKPRRASITNGGGHEGGGSGAEAAHAANESLDLVGSAPMVPPYRNRLRGERKRRRVSLTVEDL